MKIIGAAFLILGIDNVTMLCYNNNVTMLRKECAMNNEHLISKKELLLRYKISYGALYRWKRKGLIPDEWFIKKSTTTGQETFFPEKLVCERIEMIQQMKDDVLLDELARTLSGEEKNNNVLILNTEFGEKTYRLCDLNEIILMDKDGNKMDITDQIKEMFEKNNL